jgi:hypothetical protein
MQENTGDKSSKLGDLFTYGLKRGEIASRVAIGHGDLEILRMYTRSITFDDCIKHYRRATD